MIQILSHLDREKIYSVDEYPTFIENTHLCPIFSKIIRHIYTVLI